MKKSVLVIGMGKFGTHLASKMQDLGHDVMIFDRDAAAVERLSTRFADARIGDFTSEDVLREIDVSSFDVVFIMLGNDLEASMITTLLAKRLGARYVVTRARSTTEVALLRKVGADEVVYADGDKHRGAKERRDARPHAAARLSVQRGRSHPHHRAVARRFQTGFQNLTQIA